MTTESNLWLTLLEGSCADLSITCLDLIIDQTGIAPFLPGVMSVEPALPWYSLFTGRPEEGLKDQAPLLVRVDLTQPIQRFWLDDVTDHLQKHSRLLALASHWPFQTLAEHLSQCLELSDGSGLIRYYDPRLFPLLLGALQPQQQKRWLRPALFWSWLDRNGAPQRLLGNPGPPEEFGSFEPLEFSDSQFEIFGCARDAEMAVQNLNHALPPEWSAEQRYQACYAAMLEASEAGVLLKPERETFTLERLRKASTAHLTSTGNTPDA
jgi:hypothetical protein